MPGTGDGGLSCRQALVTQDPVPEDPAHGMDSQLLISASGAEVPTEANALHTLCCRVTSMEMPVTGKRESWLKATRKGTGFAKTKGSSYDSVLCTFVYFMGTQNGIFTNKST